MNTIDIIVICYSFVLLAWLAHIMWRVLIANQITPMKEWRPGDCDSPAPWPCMFRKKADKSLWYFGAWRPDSGIYQKWVTIYSAADRERLTLTPRELTTHFDIYHP